MTTGEAPIAVHHSFLCLPSLGHRVPVVMLRARTLAGE
jgi:hypothetical protein